eukprot:1928640-Rhodomonas_salina.7
MLKSKRGKTLMRDLADMPMEEMLDRALPSLPSESRAVFGTLPFQTCSNTCDAVQASLLRKSTWRR